jgi:sugar phosphate isomerase/epimerase
MTQDEILELADSLGCMIPSGPQGVEFFFYPDELEAFARAIEAAGFEMNGLSSHEWHSNTSPVHDRVKELEKQRDDLNRLCEFNEKTMQSLLDVITHIVNEVPMTSSQYELCRQAIAAVRGAA